MNSGTYRFESMVTGRQMRPMTVIVVRLLITDLT